MSHITVSQKMYTFDLISNFLKPPLYLTISVLDLIFYSQATHEFKSLNLLKFYGLSLKRFRKNQLQIIKVKCFFYVFNL